MILFIYLYKKMYEIYLNCSKVNECVCFEVPSV